MAIVFHRRDGLAGRDKRPPPPGKMELWCCWADAWRVVEAPGAFFPPRAFGAAVVGVVSTHSCTWRSSRPPQTVGMREEDSGHETLGCVAVCGLKTVTAFGSKDLRRRDPVEEKGLGPGESVSMVAPQHEDDDVG